MTLHIRLTEEEQEALAGVRLDARLLYLQGLRPYIDYKSGFVGVKRRVSYQGFRELLEVTPERGSVLGATRSPTTSALRNLLVLLERKGLLARLPQRRRTDPMVFRLPLAACDDSFRPREQRHSSDIGAAFKGTTLPNSDEPYGNHEVSSNLNAGGDIGERHSCEGEQRHTSVLPLTTTTTDKYNTRPSVPLWPEWSPSVELMLVLASEHGVPANFIDEYLAEFRLYWCDTAVAKPSWDSVFFRQCLGQWRRRKSRWQGTMA